MSLFYENLFNEFNTKDISTDVYLSPLAELYLYVFSQQTGINYDLAKKRFYSLVKAWVNLMDAAVDEVLQQIDHLSLTDSWPYTNVADLITWYTDFTERIVTVNKYYIPVTYTIDAPLFDWTSTYTLNIQSNNGIKLTTKVINSANTAHNTYRHYRTVPETRFIGQTHFKRTAELALCNDENIPVRMLLPESITISLQTQNNQYVSTKDNIYMLDHVVQESIGRSDYTGTIWDFSDTTVLVNTLKNEKVSHEISIFIPHMITVQLSEISQPQWKLIQDAYVATIHLPCNPEFIVVTNKEPTYDNYRIVCAPEFPGIVLSAEQIEPNIYVTFIHKSKYNRFDLIIHNARSLDTVRAVFDLLELHIPVFNVSDLDTDTIRNGEYNDAIQISLKTESSDIYGITQSQEYMLTPLSWKDSETAKLFTDENVIYIDKLSARLVTLSKSALDIARLATMISLAETLLTELDVDHPYAVNSDLNVFRADISSYALADIRVVRTPVLYRDLVLYYDKTVYTDLDNYLSNYMDFLYVYHRNITGERYPEERNITLSQVFDAITDESTTVTLVDVANNVIYLRNPFYLNDNTYTEQIGSDVIIYPKDGVYGLVRRYTYPLVGNIQYQINESNDNTIKDARLLVCSCYEQNIDTYKLGFIFQVPTVISNNTIVERVSSVTLQLHNGTHSVVDEQVVTVPYIYNGKPYQIVLCLYTIQRDSVTQPILGIFSGKITLDNDLSYYEFTVYPNTIIPCTIRPCSIAKADNTTGDYEFPTYITDQSQDLSYWVITLHNLKLFNLPHNRIQVLNDTVSAIDLQHTYKLIDNDYFFVCFDNRISAVYDIYEIIPVFANNSGDYIRGLAEDYPELGYTLPTLHVPVRLTVKVTDYDKDRYDTVDQVEQAVKYIVEIVSRYYTGINYAYSKAEFIDKLYRAFEEYGITANVDYHEPVYSVLQPRSYLPLDDVFNCFLSVKPETDVVIEH